MATDTVTNDVSAIQPELWSSMVQVPLYKSLVALEVANTRFSGTLRSADTLHVPYFASLTAQTYTPGRAVTANAQDWKMDNLVVSTYKAVPFYVDDPRQLTLNVDAARELASEAAYQLRDAIDQHVFANITGTDGFMPVDNQDILGGTNGAPVSATSANIIPIFAGVRKFLRQKNVEENGDWCAVVTPKIAMAIEVKAATVGFNVADATLRNGYAGDWMGFQVYISNNLPTGKATAIAPVGHAGNGGLSGAGFTATNSTAMYFGRKGMIDVVLMKEPVMEIKDVPDKLGKNFICWTVYGSTVLTKNRLRGVNLTVPSGFAG